MAARTEEIALGFQAPAFSLLNTVNGEITTLDDLKSDKATVVMFICNHCPYVIHINQELISLANDYMPKGVSFIAICSNSIVTHPQDGPERMKELAEELGFPFPYLYDESQEVAKAYFAACTPDFSVFDGNMSCVYRGALDDSIPANGLPVTGADLRNALDNVLSGQPVKEDQRASMGCSIKWNP